MIRVFAPAKINLTLKVGRPRADGMHPLASVVAFADVGDWVAAEPNPDTDAPLHIEGPFFRALMEDARENILFTALGALCDATGEERGVALTLEKNLPIASGIGGGSSDAAATLKAVNQVWTKGLSEAELEAIARLVGADVPVCVGARSAYMTGVGDEIAPIALPSVAAVLVNTLTPVPTPEVYRAFDAMGLGSEVSDVPPRWATRAELVAGAAALGNDLAPAAYAVCPELRSVEDVLRVDRRALHVALSGSGGTMFALTEDRDAALALARDVSKANPAWWVRATVLG